MFISLKRGSSLLFILLLQIKFKDALADEECISGKFDAITRTSDGNTYAFGGSIVSEIASSGNGLAPGYPKPICSVFHGLPSDVDAALYWPTNEKTYFFKGCEYYRFSGTTLDESYPKSIATNWKGLPCDIDAALVWGRNGKIYFFKGSEYYRYTWDATTDRVDSGYPLSISYGWKGVTSPVDAAFQWQNGKTYLFSGEQYFRWNDEQDKLDSGYPLTTTTHWLGCTKSSPEPTVDMCYFV